MSSCLTICIASKEQMKQLIKEINIISERFSAAQDHHLKTYFGNPYRLIFRTHIHEEKSDN